MTSSKKTFGDFPPNSKVIEIKFCAAYCMIKRPVVSVTKFKDEAHALEIANDTLYGLGAGVWTRNGNVAYRMGRGIQAGRVWTNCYHAYPAHAAFGGYKQSGIGRETHKMMLNHYRQVKNLHVSYSEKKLGFF